MNYIISIISRNIFTHSFILLCDIFHSIYDKYDKIMNSNIKNINIYKYELEKTDIKNKLSIILIIIKVIINKYNKINEMNDDNDDYELIDYKQLLINCPEILKKSIESILDVINKIKFNLDIIYNKIYVYEKSYLKILYKVNINENINEIILFNEILNNRTKLFYKLIKFYKINFN